jgi:hypothetical protein
MIYDGRNSDGNIFAKSSLGKDLQTETIIVLADVRLIGNEGNNLTLLRGISS